LVGCACAPIAITSWRSAACPDRARSRPQDGGAALNPATGLLPYTNRIASIRAATSSIIAAGTASLNFALRTRQSRDFNWWQCTAPCVSVPDPISVTTVP